MKNIKHKNKYIVIHVIYVQSEMFDVTFYFSQYELHPNCAVSDFVNTQRTEQTARPIYYNQKRVEWQGVEYNALYLVLFFMVNPGYASIGYHPGDVEKIIILKDKDTNQPKYVYYGAHGHGEGVWVPWDKCEKQQDSLIVYVSPTSHGMYPRRKKYMRVFGFANDKCDGKGERWHPQPEDFEDASKQSWSQSHFQVIRGINSPLNSPEPSIASITTFQRFFLPLPFILKRVKNQPKIKVM